MVSPVSNSSASEFFRSVSYLSRVKFKSSTYEKAFERLYQKFSAAGSDEQSTIADPFGGFLLPTIINAELTQRTFDFSRIAKRCKRVPIDFDGVQLPAFRESSRVDGSRLGGITSYWTSETQAPTVSRAQFQQIKLGRTATLAVLIPASEEFLRVPAAGEVLLSAAAEELAVRTDSAVLVGTGTGMPAGIVREASVISVAKEAGQSADTIVKENIVKAVERLWPYSDGSAVWLASRSAQREILNGNAVDLVRFAEPSDTGDARMSLSGFPFIVVEQAPPLGDAGDILLADLSQYVLGSRGPIKTTSSTHVRFLQHESVFRFDFYIDGRAIWAGAVSAMNGADASQSPFVMIAERA